MTVLRWLLVPVSAVLVVAAVVYAGLFAVDIADQNCAPDSFAAGACVAAWHTTALEAIIFSGLVLATAGLVLVPAMIAPKLKITISVIGFLIAVGPLAAAAITSGSLPIPIIVPGDLTMPLILAIVAGGGSLFWVRARAARTSS